MAHALAKLVAVKRSAGFPLPLIGEMYAFGVFERAFKEFGMPLSPYPQDRFEYRVRRTERRHQRGEREDLAGDLCTTTWVSSITKRGA